MGCAAQMVGFAVMCFKENRTAGLLSLVFGITRTGNIDPDTIQAGAGGFSGTPYGWSRSASGCAGSAPR